MNNLETFSTNLKNLRAFTKKTYNRITKKITTNLEKKNLQTFKTIQKY